jgi:hypothetical protein
VGKSQSGRNVTMKRQGPSVLHGASGIAIRRAMHWSADLIGRDEPTAARNQGLGRRAP